MTTTNFQIDKNDLFKTAFEKVDIPELVEGEILFKIEKYALTSNNITYAVFGERLQYWNFFPAQNDNGIIPVWGYATVVESKNAAIKTGERVYGYLPMSDYLKVQPAKVTSFGFADSTAHRTALPPIYNYYHRLESDVSYQKETEDFIPITRPLFATSFLSYHFLKNANFHGSENIFLTSASSKTALGLAFLLKKHQKEDGNKIIGLTSNRNLEFVKNTGFYDEVFDYENYKDNLPTSNSMLVDFAGNADLLNDLIEGMGDNMKYMSLIGFTDWQSGRAVKNPIAEFFFAPTQAQKVYKEWGVEVANQRIAEGLNDFIAEAKNWIDLVYVNPQNDLADLYLKMLKGDVDPKKGYIVKN